MAYNETKLVNEETNAQDKLTQGALKQGLYFCLAEITWVIMRGVWLNRQIESIIPSR